MNFYEIESHPEVIDIRASIAVLRYRYNDAVIQRQYGLTVRLNQALKDQEKVLRKKIATLRGQAC